MLRATLAGLWVRRLRLLTSTLAVVLGVGFIVGATTLNSTAKHAFFEEFAVQARHVDAAVLPATSSAKSAPGIGPQAIARIHAMPGVAALEVRRKTTVALRTDRSHTAAATAVDIPADPRFRDLTLTSGQWATDQGEALLDDATATQRGLHPGDHITVINSSGASRSLRLTGFVDLGLNKELATAGSPVIALPAPGMPRITGTDSATRLDVAAAPGVSRTALLARLTAAAGPSTTVLTGDQLAHRLAQSVTGQVDLFLQGILLFSLVAMGVAALVINNTFKILIAQRTRELALLRCVGATRRQLFTSVLLEALAVGSAGGLAGAGAGIVSAYLLRGLLSQFHSGIPSGPLVLSGPGIALGVGIGVAATLAAAVLPARLATRVSPVTALQTLPDAAIDSTHARLLRAISGTLLTAAGLATIATGMPRGRTGLFFVAGGGGVLFLAAMVTSPLLVRPLTTTLGWLPSRLGSVPARLAVGGAQRNPHRTATTMIALTIGVGLMAAFSVVLDTAGTYAGDQVDKHYPIDAMISSIDPAGTVSPSVAARLRAEPRIAAAGEARTSDQARLNGLRLRLIAAVDPTANGTVYRPQTTAGTLARPLSPGQIALHQPLAARLHLGLGSTVHLSTPGGTDRPYTVAALYTTRFFGEQALIGWKDFTTTFPTTGDTTVLVLGHPHTPARAINSAISRATHQKPLLRVTTVAAYRAQLTATIDQMTQLLNAMLATAVLIALFGIANTLSLSAQERTRETALLRALGLTTAQLRRTMTIEALFIGLMGGIIGITLGGGVGWAISRTFLHEAGGGRVSFPATTLATYLGFAALAALTAASLPARRSARVPIISGLTSG